MWIGTGLVAQRLRDRAHCSGLADHLLDRDAVRERLRELARHVTPAAGDTLQHDPAGARAVVDDGRLDLVAFLETHLTRLGIAKLVLPVALTEAAPSIASLRNWM
jgi:hypothetical protein